MKNGRFAFLSPLGGLGATYDVYLRLIGKRVEDFHISVNWTFFARFYAGLAWYIYIYRRYLSLIYIRYFPLKISDIFDIFDIFDFYRVFKIFLMWHIVTMFWFIVCVFCWLMTCALSIFSVLDNFCQITPLHMWMTRVLQVICKTHIHTIIW